MLHADRVGPIIDSCVIPSLIMSSPTTGIVLVAIAKNEGRYLVEFVHHYCRLGFEKIIIYDNESTDTTAATLDMLSGVFPVEWRVWASVAGVSPQDSAYRHALESLGDHDGWIAYFDVDEFLMVTGRDTLDDVLERARAGGFSAIGVSQRVFGSNGEQGFRNEPVLERFPNGCEPGHTDCRWFKSIYHRPRTSTIGNCHATPDLQFEYCHPNGAALTFTDIAELPGVAGTTDFSCLQLNHYMTKSFDELLLKRDRGDASAPPELKHVRYADMSLFHDRAAHGSRVFCPHAAEHAALNRAAYAKLVAVHPTVRFPIDPYASQSGR